MRTFLLIALTVALVACSSGQSAPQPTPVQSYGPTSQAQPARPAPPNYQGGQPTPSYAPAAPAPATYGAFRWHTRIADAQAQARRENKLILVGSTKPGCSLCEKFKNQVVPSGGSRVSSQVVGYMVHALTPEAPHVWNQLKANLPTARLMPLVGVFTPDLRYLTGFGGPADMNQLTTALGTARRLYPAAAQAPQRPMPAEARYTAQLNEYGEYEWTPVQPVEPEDALTADVTTGADPVLPPADAAVPTADPVPVVAAAPAPVAPAPVAPAPVAMAPVPAVPVVAAVPPPPARPKRDVAPAWIPPEDGRAVPVVQANRPAGTPVVAARRNYAAPKAAPRPRPPFSREPEPAMQTWGETALRQALDQIQSGELARAKSTLAEVHARLPGSTLAREASKGAVAIYNTERLQDAQAPQREQIRAQAERNLGHSMWAVLFQS